MIFITGDTHREENFLKLKVFAEKNQNLTKKDYMIIAGDFGGVWSEKTLEKDLDMYSELPFTVLFVDGNHENFDLLNAYPISIWNGGKVHIIRDDIIHLMRGQIFKIEGKTFFAFGGATSYDRATRRANDTGWWKEERPTFEEMDEGFLNLDKVGYKVDYIVTHSCDEKALWYPPLRQGTTMMERYPENDILSNFEDRVTYSHWYFGHFHMDADLTDKKTILFNEIRRLI